MTPAQLEAVLHPSPSPHGKPVVYHCAGAGETPQCRVRNAAYPGSVPAGWVLRDGKWWCPVCARDRR